MVESIGVFQQRYVVMLYISSKRRRIEINKKMKYGKAFGSVSESVAFYKEHQMAMDGK